MLPLWFLLSPLIVVLLLQLLLPLQDMPVVLFFFFSIHKADVSSTGIGFMHLGGVRKLHVFRVVPTMASVYLDPLNTDDDRFLQSALLPPTDHSALTTHHHRHITIRIEHRRDHIHERIIPFCKL